MREILIICRDWTKHVINSSTAIFAAKKPFLDALPDEADAIFNFAAESHVDRSINSASEFVLTNVLGTQVLLDAARAKNVRRFVQISTDEVMGSLPEDERFVFYRKLADSTEFAVCRIKSRRRTFRARRL